jgi:hypothetical protein
MEEGSFTREVIEGGTLRAYYDAVTSIASLARVHRLSAVEPHSTSLA